MELELESCSPLLQLTIHNHELEKKSKKNIYFSATHITDTIWFLGSCLEMQDNLNILSLWLSLNRS